MMIAWLIGLVLSLCVIWLLKDSRVRPKRNCWGDIVTSEKPVLRIWSLSLLILFGIVPLVNLGMVFVMTIVWVIAVFGDEDWTYKKNFPTKVLEFFNKPIE